MVSEAAPKRPDENLDQSRGTQPYGLDTAADDSDAPGDLVRCPGTVVGFATCLPTADMTTNVTAVALAAVATHTDRKYGAAFRRAAHAHTKDRFSLVARASHFRHYARSDDRRTTAPSTRMMSTICRLPSRFLRFLVTAYSLPI